MVNVAAAQADVNWLLSTAVQSGAALVAIIGGLLVARLVGLSSERESLRRRLREAREVVRQHAAELTRVTERLDRMNARQLLKSGSGEIMTSHGEVTVEALVDEWGWDPGAYGSAAIVEPHLNRVRSLFAEIERCLSDVNPHHADLSDLSTNFDAADHEFVSGALDQLKREAPRPRDKYTIFADVPQSQLVLTPQNEIQERNRRFAEAEAAVEDAGIQLRRVEIEETNARAALEAVSRPPGIGRYLLVLLYLTLVCIVGPLTLMAWGREALPAVVRAVAVLVFTSGLGVFLWMLRSMTRADPELAATDDKPASQPEAAAPPRR